MRNNRWLGKHRNRFVGKLVTVVSGRRESVFREDRWPLFRGYRDPMLRGDRDPMLKGNRGTKEEYLGRTGPDIQGRPWTVCNVGLKYDSYSIIVFVSEPLNSNTIK
jgi:hypothetical protein